MVKNKVSENLGEVWISYIDDTEIKVNGFFILIEQNANYVKIQSGSNILIIPWHRINKLKQKMDSGWK